DELRDILTGVVGFCPSGLRENGPQLAVRLDGMSFGGPLAVIGPVADGNAFKDSLEHAPGLRSLGHRAYRLSPPARSMMAFWMTFAAAMATGGPVAAIKSLGQSPTADYTLQVEVRDGRAILAPSYEALSVCRRFAEQTNAFADAPARDVVASLDIR